MLSPGTVVLPDDEGQVLHELRSLSVVCVRAVKRDGRVVFTGPIITSNLTAGVSVGDSVERDYHNDQTSWGVCVCVYACSHELRST